MISKNLFRREVLEYGARCGVAMGAAVVGSSVNKKMDEAWKKGMVSLITNQLILEAFLFRSDVSAGAANSIRLCAFALKATVVVVKSAVEGKLPEKLSPLQESLQKKVRGVVLRLFYPFAILMDRLASDRLKKLTQAVGLEVLFGGLLQEVLLRQLPKYIFTATQLCPAEIVDSLPARVARIALCSLVFGISFGDTAPFRCVGNFLSWGAGPGYLTETLGFAPAAIQTFAGMLSVAKKNLERAC